MESSRSALNMREQEQLFGEYAAMRELRLRPKK